MNKIIEVLPNYEPKIDELNTAKIDLNIRDLQKKYPNGCICCGNTYLPKKYSSLISQHFNTNKHKRICLQPQNELFKQDYGSSNTLNDAFDKKCKENRYLKKLNYDYKDELDKLKKKYDELEKLNLELEKINILLQKKCLDSKPQNIRIANLIDF